MINTETISFLGELNSLAKKSKNGIRPFSKVTKENKDEGILYKDEEPFGEVDGKNFYPVICNALIDDCHHDIINTYSGSYANIGIHFTAVKNGDENGYIQVTSSRESNFCVIICDGEWYSA